MSTRGQSATFQTEDEETEPAQLNTQPKIGYSCARSKSSTTGVTKFHGMLVEDLLFIEVFAGMAKLSKAAKDVGFQILPIDKTSASASQIFVAQYDLTEPDAVQALVEVLRTEAHRIAAVHFAPACGTASKAREKKLRQFVKKGYKAQFHSDQQTNQWDWTGFQAWTRLGQRLLVKECISLGILCSVENPENSLFWNFPDILKLLETFPGHSVSFHNCMHGGKRNKLTKWWASDDTFEALRSTCDNSRTHAKWNPVPVGRQLSFPTADEAAYPGLLCKRFMSILLQHVRGHSNRHDAKTAGKQSDYLASMGFGHAA